MHLGGHEDSLIRNDDLRKEIDEIIGEVFGDNNVGFQPEEEESEMVIPSLVLKRKKATILHSLMIHVLKRKRTTILHSLMIHVLKRKKTTILPSLMIHVLKRKRTTTLMIHVLKRKKATILHSLMIHVLKRKRTVLQKTCPLSLK